MTVQHHTWLHRDLLRLQGGLHVRLVFRDDLLDVRVEVDIDPLRALFDLQTEEGGKVLRQRDVEVSRILMDELLLQHIARGGMNHVVHVETMDNPVLSGALHEDGLLAVDGKVSPLLHPG